MVSLAAQLLEGGCIDTAKALSSKTDKSDALEDLKGLSTKNVQRISIAMAEKVAGALDQLAIEREYLEVKHIADGEDETQPDSPDKKAMVEAESHVKASVVVLKAFVDIFDDNLPEELDQLIVDLCGEAVLGFPARESMQDTVARLGLEFLCSRAPGRLGVCVQLVPYLLWKLLRGDGKAADAKRLSQAAAAGAFQILDLEQADSKETIEMILLASMHPVMLQSTEGRRCIAFFLDLGPAIARALLSTMRAQIQMGKEAVLEAYGEILYRAWENCSDESQEYIEQECIQDLMNAAILARTAQLHTNLERVLSYLHDQKSTAVVQEMLQRLYKPILWPALAAPNANVRRNAISMLLSAFPITGRLQQGRLYIRDHAFHSCQHSLVIQDGKHDKEVLEETVTMQVTRIANAMRDTDPTIRKQVAAGACVLLSKWWELLTTFGGCQLIGKLMALLKYSAFDSESPKTRVAVLEGLAVLVENPLAQTAVAITLKDIKPLLFDSNRSVRRAMVELIQQVANIKTLKWWETFPPADLISVMGTDNKEVAGIIHSMLFTQLVEGDELNLQACAGLMQILRDSSSAGAAFCQTLADRAVSGDDENISVDSVAGFAVDLADYLAACTIKTPPAKSKAKTAEPDAHGRKEGEENLVEAGGGSNKRPRAEEEDEYGEWETLEGWTGIVCGLKELIVPMYMHFVRQIDAAAENEEASTSKTKKGRRTGGVKQRTQGRDAARAEILLQEILPSEMLVALLQNAPTTDGVQLVLSIGAATPRSQAAIALAQHCLGQVQCGFMELPNLRKKAGSKVHSIKISAVPRQGHLPPEQCKQASVLCVMMDLLVSCDSGELLNVLCSGLGTQPDLPSAARSSKRTRNTASKKKGGKGKTAGDAVLDVNGALTLLPMLFRCGVDVRNIGAAGLPELLEVLGEATKKWTSKLSAGHTAATSVLNDAILTSHCFHCASAVVAAQGVAMHADIIEGINDHGDRMRARVLDSVDEGSQQPIDVDDICSQLFASVSHVDAQAGNKAKRTRTLESGWRATDQQSAMLNILSHCTLDLGVRANTALDRYEDLLYASQCPDKYDVTDAAVDEAEIRAVDACTDAWASGKALVERHTGFVMDHIADPTMRQVLCMSTMECTPAICCSLEAVLRGLQAARLPGDLPQLISIVGVHLAIAQAVCTLCGANAKLSGRLDKLSGVVLHGWYILADESDGHAQNRAATDTIQSPLQGLSEDQQQEYIPDLLHATFTVLGLLRTQSASDDEDSLVDTRIAADWLFKGIKALSTSVASTIRKALCQHMKVYLDKTEADTDENTRLRHMGCKMLMSAVQG